MVAGGKNVVLTIAGFDPGSGAGATADLKTIAANRGYGVAAITALTVQNTQGVFEVHPVAEDTIRQTLSKLAEDVSFSAIKVGMVGSLGVAKVIADFLTSQPKVPVVLDPVLRSSSGKELLDAAGVDFLRGKLLRLAIVITPNLPEAEVLTGYAVRTVPEMREASKKLQSLGARNVIVTGGHLPENTDLLRSEFGEEVEIAGPRSSSKASHGTGCAFSTAIACRLGLGDDLKTAARAAKDYVRRAIEAGYPIGAGYGPMNHLFRLDED